MSKQDENKEVKKTDKRIPPKIKDKPDTTPEPKVVKPYVHIDTFLQTATTVFNVSGVEAEGFKARMEGQHYQRDEQIFLKELKKYLKIKS